MQYGRWSRISHSRLHDRNTNTYRNGGTIIAAKHIDGYADIDATYSEPEWADTTDYHEPDYYEPEWYASGNTDRYPYSFHDSIHRSKPAHRIPGVFYAKYYNADTDETEWGFICYEYAGRYGQ